MIETTYSKNMLYTHTLTINNKHQSSELILCCCGCIKYIRCPWFKQFKCLYLVYCAWAGFGGGEAQEDKLHVFYCSCAIQHVTWYVHTHALLLLASISQNFASDLHTSLKFKLSCTVASYNVSSVWYLCVQYVKPLLHFDIRPCCHQSVHAFTSWYDSPLFDCTFFTLKGVFAWDYHHFCKGHALL